MPTALVVDDSKVDQKLAASLLENRVDIKVLYASNGEEALQVIAEKSPDLVLTDMNMPEMDGLQLVHAIRERFANTPVILMTAMGSEEIASQALRAGASGYVPKRYLSRDLAPVVERTLALSGHQREQISVLDCLTYAESRFELTNDTALIHPLLQYLRQDMARLCHCDETELMRVRVALDEALNNAIIHGNLEVSSDLRGLGGDEYHTLIEERAHLSPYQERRVFVTSKITPTKATFIIEDQGSGFDPSTLPDPTDPANLDKASGRGLLLIGTFIDEVSHNDSGNQITLIKNCEA